MIDPGTAIAVGGAIYGAVRGGGRGRARRRAIADYRSAKPQGYTTGEDLRAAELTKGRLTEGVQREGELAGYGIARRSRARGLAGSPSEERDRARLEQQVLLGTQHAGESAEEQIYNVRMGREQFAQQRERDIFGAEAGAASQEAARQSAEQAAYWNSLTEFLPTILGNIDTPTASLKAAATGVPGATYRPPGRMGYQPASKPVAL